MENTSTLIIKDGRFDLVKELPDSTIYPAGDLSDSLKLVSMLYLIISNVQNSGYWSSPILAIL